jgi:hypothetical protein
VERAALIPAFSRREKENMLREVCRVEAGVRWNELRRLGRLEFRHVAVRDLRLPLPPGEVGVREPVSTLAMATLGRFMEREQDGLVGFALHSPGWSDRLEESGLLRSIPGAHARRSH